MSTTGRVPRQLPLLPASDFCQRWREQRVVWRHRHAAGETFVPQGYEVAPIGRPETADFLRHHHYLHKLPANRFRFGLRRGADLVGIAVFGPGMPGKISVWESNSPWSRIGYLPVTNGQCGIWLS